MGYAPVTVVMYGIDVPATKQARLYKSFGATVLRDLRNCPNREIAYSWKTGTAEEALLDSVYPVDDTELLYRDGRTVCGVEMRLYGGDSRAGNCIYSEDGSCCFGIFLGSSGYGWFDDLAKIVTNVPEQAKKNWRRYCVPLLARVGIKNARPKCKFVTQIW